MTASSGAHSVVVSTGSRLHFGLTRVRRTLPVRFDGAGVMIDQPKTELCVRPAAMFSTCGCKRIERFAKMWCLENGRRLPACEICLVDSPPAHSGLGSGTQLAQAVAAGLTSFLDQPADCTQRENHLRVLQAAQCLDRGNRSMIGSYGFLRGGLIVDGTDQAGNSLLAEQLSISCNWRVVLVFHQDANKKFGLQEQSAFDNIGSGPKNRPQRLENLIAETMVPAAQSEDFERFAESVHEYGKLTGEYYKNVQGGIYNGHVISSVVTRLSELNAKGIGQSSWGPVVFSWCENQPEAEDLLSRIVEQFGNTAKAWIASVRNQPATVTRNRNRRDEIQSA